MFKITITKLEEETKKGRDWVRLHDNEDCTVKGECDHYGYADTSEDYIQETTVLEQTSDTTEIDLGEIFTAFNKKVS